MKDKSIGAVLKNIGWLIFDKVFILIMNMVVIFIIANFYGPEKYGLYQDVGNTKGYTKGHTKVNSEEDSEYPRVRISKKDKEEYKEKKNTASGGGFFGGEWE